MGVISLVQRLSLGRELSGLQRRDPPTDEASAVVMVTGGERPRHLLYVPAARLVDAFCNLLRSRHEWLEVPGTSNQVGIWCDRLLQHLGLNPDALAEVARAGMVQLTFNPGLPAEASEFPWEFALAEATRPLRQLSTLGIGTQFLVYRHLQVPTAMTKGRGADDNAPPTKLLVVESAPGPLGGIYRFESERRLVESGLGPDIGAQELLQNPNVKQLLSCVKEAKPDVIHLMGFDNRQGDFLLSASAHSVPLSASAHSVPGMYFSGASAPIVIPYAELAKVLTSGGPPQLVAFNIYNSSLGAAEAVKSGAAAAIGFQDEIDDWVAELFFASFYGEWKRSEWNLLYAFNATKRNLYGHANKMRGTGIVLWTNRPLFEANAAVRRGVTAGLDSAATAGASPSPVNDPDAARDVFEYLAVDYEWPRQLNYSLLHNNANIIPKFVIKRQKPGSYRGIKVEVRLSAGTQEAWYRTTLALDDARPTEDLHDSVRVPLTSELIRTLDESMFSTIYTTVRWGQHVRLEDTQRVMFMPVDEWKYDKLNGRWLPSFVFPRDPIIREIVNAAQRYLVALRDDSGAGFDGYQSYEPTGASRNERSRNIDAQVQAIWWALVNDYGLGYINPPPNFTDHAQRLRTPSEVIGGKRGTCIDLTLLLVACLEYVEIYPVIFLLNDHAFPGYWRSLESHEKLGEMSLGASASVAEATAVPGGAPAWMLGRSRFADVTALVNQGHVVPLESVSLTSHSGFWPAVEEGQSNLRSKRQFHSMFDLLTARNHVTPIPIWSKRA